MDFNQQMFGLKPTLRGRGVIGATPLNLNALIQPITSIPAGIFDAAYALDYSSSSAADAAAGTGARTIETYGLDKDWNPVSETVTLNGQTKVTGTQTFRRVFGCFTQTAGTGRFNAGDIYVVKTGTGGTYTAGVPGTLTSGALKMLVGDNNAFSGVFTAPAGTQYMLTAISAMARAQAATITLFHGKPTNTVGAGPFAELKVEVGAGTSLTELDFSDNDPLLILNQKEDCYFQAVAAGASGILNVLCKFKRITPGI